MFDPYHKWLGIPNDQRPPTHYQLLGLSPNEQDLEVIEEAAIRQTTHVRAYQIGPHSAECTQLQKEISTARLTLLNPAKRTAYDEQLAHAGKGRAAPAEDTGEAGIKAGTPQRGGAAPYDAEVFGEPPEGTAQAPRTHKHPENVKKAGSPIGLFIGLGVGAVLLLFIVIGAGVGFWFLRSDAPARKAGHPIVQNKGKDGKKPIRDVEAIKKDDALKKDDAPKNDDFNVKNPDPDPAPAKKPEITLAMKGRIAPELVLDLPKGIVAPCLTNDGLRVAYTTFQSRALFYREAPDFAREHEVSLPGEANTRFRPSVSSPDGKKMLLLSQGGDNRGYSALLWDWHKLSVEAEIPVLGLPQRAVLAPDMKHLATVVMRRNANTNEYWVQLHQIGPNPVEVKRWKADWHATCVAFTPDSSTLYFTAKNAPRWHTYALKTDESGELPFAQYHEMPAFSTDFSRYALKLNPFHTEVRMLDANRVQWVLHPENKTRYAGASFSQDNRFLLCGTFVQANNLEDSLGQIALVDLSNGAVVSASDPRPGIPNNVQLGANGIALAHSYPNMTRLYRFPTGPGDTFVKIGPPKKENPLPKEVPVIKDNPPPVKVARVAVPDADKVAESEKTIREQFKKEYAKKPAGDVLALAEKLHKLAGETADDPTARYVLLRETRDLAVKAGRAELAMKAVTDLCAKYEMDELAQRVETLLSFTKLNLTADGYKQYVEIALLHAGHAMMDDHFDEATKIMVAADAVARRSNNTALLTQVQKQDKQIKEVAKDFTEMKAAQAKLAEDAKDAQANLTVGLYLAFRKGNWELGLPMLALCNSAELQDLAKKDLAVADDDKARVELGDGWWSGAEKKPAYQKTAMQWRAVYWYRQALPSLKGLIENKVTERVKQVDAQPAPFRVAAGAGEVDRFKGHKGPVSWLSLSTDGKRLFSCGEDGTLRTWDVSTGKMRVLLGPQATKGSLICFAISPDERQAALLSPGGNLASLHLTTLKLGQGNPETVPGFLWTNNTTVAYAFKDSWQTWDVVKSGGSAGPAVFGTPPVRGNVRMVVWAPDQDAGAFLCSDETVVTFRAQNNGLRLSHAAIPLNGTAAGFPKDAGFVVLGGKDGYLRAFSMTVKANDTAKELGTFKGHSGTLRAIACTPDGKTMISGGDDKTMRIWDVATGKQLQRSVHSGGVTSLVVTPDGRHVISACADSIIRVWTIPK